MPPDQFTDGPALSRSKRKKVDREALHSPFMRIPGMQIVLARGLLNLGLREIYELQGRSPEVLFEEIRRHHPDLPGDFLPLLRLAVHCAENPGADASGLRKEDFA